MNQDIFSGLLKGFGAFLPQDDPEVKLMNLQSQLSDAKQALQNSYAALGLALLPTIEKDERYKKELDLIAVYKHQVATLQTQLDDFMREKQEREQIAQSQARASYCQACGSANEAGAKFCQDCGKKLGGLLTCSRCGKENPLDTRFCSECGTRL